MRSARLLAALLLLLASSARAVSVDIVSIDSANPLMDLRVGDSFSVSIRLSNPDELPLITAAAHAYGWDDSILAATNAERSTSVFNTALVPGGPIIPDDPGAAGGATPAGGIINIYTLRPEPPQTIHPSGGFTISRLVEGVIFGSAAGTGDLDLGIDGGLVGDGDAHARVTFHVLAPGTTSISFGSHSENGDAIFTADGQRFNPETTLRISATDAVDPIPEPSAALVFAAGLVATATLRQRRA